MSLLKKRITQEGRKQSQLAAAISERTKESAGTIEARLSAIGGPDGDAYFFSEKSPLRLSALASELGIEEAELRALREAPTLVLDPRLPAEAIAFLQQAAGATFDVEVVESAGPELWQHLRDAARAERNGIVVVSDLRESRHYFDGASVAHTELMRVPRGFRLVSRPELVPVPPRPVAPTQAADGTLLLRADALKTWMGRRWPEYEFEEREREAAARDEDLMLTLKDIEEYLPLHVTLKDSVFWVDELTTGMQEAFAPHPVKSWKEALRKQIEGRNPFRLVEASKDLGFTQKEYFRRQTQSEREKWQKSAPPVVVSPQSGRADLVASFRAGVKALLSRDLRPAQDHCSHDRAYTACPCITALYFPFVLEAVLRAQVVIAEYEGALVGSVDLGAGCVGVFRLARYVHDEPAPVVFERAKHGSHDDAGDYLVDGGDIVLSLLVVTIPALMGSPRLAFARE